MSSSECPLSGKLLLPWDFYLYDSALCLIVALTVLNCFCCQLSKVAFSMSLCPSGALDRAPCLTTQKWNCFSGLLYTDLCLSAAFWVFYFSFISQVRVDLMIWRPDERTTAIWAGWLRTWSPRAPPANPYFVSPSPLSGGQAVRLLMLVWGWEQDFKLASLSAGVCFQGRWRVVTWLYCPPLPALEGDFFCQQMCYTSRGNGICLWGQVQKASLLSPFHPVTCKALFTLWRPKE